MIEKWAVMGMKIFIIIVIFMSGFGVACTRLPIGKPSDCCA
jgi:hypothetical protein